MAKISKKLKTKSDLILQISKNNKLSISTSSLVVDTILENITLALLKDNKVELRGFGTFGVKKYKAYKGRNPQNQETVTVRSKRRPWFKPGQIRFLLNKK